MTTRKGLLAALVVLTLGLTAAAAAADTTTTTTTTVTEYTYTSPPSVVVTPPPPSPPVVTRYEYRYCYTEAGHWRWDGFRYVYEPGQTVCRSS